MQDVLLAKCTTYVVHYSRANLFQMVRMWPRNNKAPASGDVPAGLRRQMAAFSGGDSGADPQPNRTAETNKPGGARARRYTKGGSLDSRYGSSAGGLQHPAPPVYFSPAGPAAPGGFWARRRHRRHRRRGAQRARIQQQRYAMFVPCPLPFWRASKLCRR